MTHSNPWDCYAVPTESGLEFIKVGQNVPTEHVTMVHAQLRAFVQADVCVGGRSVVNSRAYRIGWFPDMQSSESIIASHSAIQMFVKDQDEMTQPFSSFFAIFSAPIPIDETRYEKLLWGYLQKLHEVDKLYNEWDRAVSDEPQSPNFSFSVGGRAFFIVGMHPASSRYSRRFGWPTLVFNAHYLFDNLRSQGHFERFQSVNRARDRALQEGTINPNLSSFGEISEARQYSGRFVEADWCCPFKTKSKQSH